MTSSDSAMLPPGQSLTTVAALSDGERRRLQALAITTVEDLQVAMATNPDDLASFMGVADFSALAVAAPPVDQYIALDVDELPGFGAEPPPEVEPLEFASEDFFAASLAALGPEPNDAEQPAGRLAGGPVQVDCIASLRPVRYQGSRGTCVAHAVAAVLEYLHLHSTGEPIDLSPQFLYWAAKHHDASPHKAGTLIRVATDCAVNIGVCEEAQWQYNPVPAPGNESQDPPPAGAAEAAAGRRAAGVVDITPKSSAAICASLDHQIPVAFSIPVYAVWLSPVGKIPMPIPGAPRQGGHAMCAAGYLLDDSVPGGGYLIVKNSWGTTRAPLSPAGPGYYYLPFEYVDQYGWESQTLH